MRFYIMRVAAAAAAVLAVTIWPASAQAHVATHSTKTVVYGFGGNCPPTNWSNPLVRPGRAFFSLPCENGVRRIHWQNWRAASAAGHATILIFNGLGFTPHSGTIRLSTVRMHRGQHLRMAVAQAGHGGTAGGIQISLAFGVGERHAAPRHRDGGNGAQLAMHHMGGRGTGIHDLRCTRADRDVVSSRLAQ